MEKEDGVNVQGEDGYLEAKERILEQMLPSRHSERINIANTTLTLDL